MRSNRLILLVLSIIALTSGLIIWYTVHSGEDKPVSVSFALALELLSDVIMIVLIDLMIRDRHKRLETKTTLMRDLYSEEEEIRLLALDNLIDERLLQGSILNAIDFSTLNLNGRRFYDVTFFKCRFFGSQLKNARFEKCKFIRADFSGANLNTAQIYRSVLDRCNLSGSFFDDSEISESSFDNCNLDNGHFNKSNILESTFRKCTADNLVASELNIDSESAKSFPGLRDRRVI